MKRPLGASEVTKLSADYVSNEWHFLYHVPQIIAPLSIAAVPQHHPASVVAFTGSAFNAQPGQTVWVGNNNSSNLGIVRIREWVNGSLLPIAETGSGLINWSAATTLVVKDEYLPLGKFPRYANDQWYMDWEQGYNLNASMTRPYANLGGAKAIPLVNGVATASFVGENSLFWDSPSLVATWQFPDGQTVFRLGTAACPVVVNFTATSTYGSYVTLTVIDNRGGSHTGRRLLYVYDKSKVPSTEIEQIEGSQENGGYSAQIKAYNLPKPVSPHSQLTIAQYSNYGAGSQLSLGTNDHFHKEVIFTGYPLKVSTVQSAYSNTTVIDAATVNQIELTSYPIFLAYNQSGNDWIEWPRLSLDRVTKHILTERSTLGDIFDFNPLSGVGLQEGLILFQDLPGGTIWDQLQTNITDKGVLGGDIGVDMQGNIHQMQNFLVTGGSAAATTVFTIGKDLALGNVLIEEEPVKSLAYFRAEAVTSVTPLGAEIPGRSKGYYGGGDRIISKGLTVQDQATLITQVGNVFARQNKVIKRVQVQLPFIPIDCIPDSKVYINSLSSQGFNLTGVPLNIRGSRFEMDVKNGVAFTTLDLEPYVNGLGGSSITFPTLGDLVPIPPPDPSPDPTPPSTVGTTGMGTLYVMTQTTLGRTRDVSVSSPVYTNITPSGGLDLRDFILDPWMPANNGYLATTDGIYKSTNLDSSSPTWTRVLSAATVEATLGLANFRHPNKISGSINIQDWVGFWFLIGTTANPNFYFAYSNNGGTSWSYVQINNPSVFPSIENHDGWTGSADVVPHVVGSDLVLYATIARGGSGTTRQNYVYKSTDRGLTWSQIDVLGTNVTDMMWTLHCPYTNNEDGNLVYVFGQHDAGVGMAYSTDGTNFTSRGDITITAYDNQMHRWGTETYTQSDQVYYWDANATQLYVSTTGAAGTFSARGMNGISGAVYTSGGFPYNNQQFYAVTANGIFISVDGGNNWVDKTGNWSWGFSSSFSVNKPKGGTTTVRGYVVVPLWTE